LYKKGIKCPAVSETNSSVSTVLTNEEKNSKEKTKSRNARKKKSKKVDKNTQISIKDYLQPMERNFIQNTEKYPISFSNFTVLIDIVRGLPDPLDTITLFTDDIPGIISILVDNYKFLEHATIKNRFTRLRKKLSAILNPSEADNGSENLDNESEAFEIESESIDSDCAST